jgi:predicted DNA-binding helix-hairpin-helix protein
MVVGASPEPDNQILTLAENLYLAYDVRRVYYSAFLPAGDDPRVPALARPPLAREHRLYQADWLFRFYGFAAAEILEPSQPWLDLQLDPKSAWALRHPEIFPLDVCTADYRQLLRIPGIGPKAASRIVAARRLSRLSVSSLPGMGVVMRRARWFITVAGRSPESPAGTGFRGGRSAALDHPELLRRELLDPAFRGAPAGQLEFDWGGEA